MRDSTAIIGTLVALLATSLAAQDLSKQSPAPAAPAAAVSIRPAGTSTFQGVVAISPSFLNYRSGT